MFTSNFWHNFALPRLGNKEGFFSLQPLHSFFFLFVKFAIFGILLCLTKSLFENFLFTIAPQEFNFLINAFLCLCGFPLSNCTAIFDRINILVLPLRSWKIALVSEFEFGLKCLAACGCVKLKLIGGFISALAPALGYIGK